MNNLMERGLEAITSAFIHAPKAGAKNGDVIVDFFTRSEIIDLLFYLRLINLDRPVSEFRVNQLIKKLEAYANGTE